MRSNTYPVAHRLVPGIPTVLKEFASTWPGETVRHAGRHPRLRFRPVSRWTAGGIRPRGIVTKTASEVAGGPNARFRAERRPLLMACSPHVVARPRDWPAEVEMTGYWFLDRPPEWVPLPDLMRFLRADPPPICIGFGSMTMADPGATAALVTEAVAKAGCRAVIGAGWGGLRPPQQHDNIYSTEELPHDWLFPQMAAVVHHCGAGTTASALRAGLPSVPVPFMADQFFWVRRLRRLGVATAAVPHRKLSVQALVAALRNAMNDDEMRQRARSLGAAIRPEDGLLRAVAAVEKHASQLTQRVGRVQQTLARPGIRP